MIILSEEDYDKLQAVLNASIDALQAAQVLRGVGDNITRQHMVMQSLQSAVNAAASVQVQAVEDANSKRTKRSTR